MTGRTWLLVVVLILALFTLGPMVVQFVQGALHGSLNTMSSNFNFNGVIS